MTATTAKKMFLLIFVFDILAALSRCCGWRVLRNHNFIIPHVLRTSCPEPAGQGGENGGLEELLHVEDILSDDPQL